MSDINDKIDRYIIGKLSGEEKEQLEKQLSENSELKEEYIFRKKMISGLAAAHRDELKNKFAEYAERELKGNMEAPQAKVVGMRPMRRVLAIAATFLVLAAAAFWLFQENAPTRMAIIEKNAKWPSGDDFSLQTNLKGDNNPSDKLTEMEKKLINSQDAYDSGDMELAKNIALSIDTTLLSENQKRLYIYQLGILHLRTGDFENAEKNLTRNDATESSSRQWYLAWLKLEKGAPKNELIETFSQIANSRTSIWSDEAAAVLEELKNMKE